MITVKLTTYNDAEKRFLYEALKEAHTKLTEAKCDPSIRCCYCEFRHVCYALEKSASFVEKEVVKK